MIDLEEKYLTELKDILEVFFRRQPWEVKAYMFGSRVTGKAAARSDIDIALKAEKAFPFGVISRLKEFFAASLIPYSVDVIDLNGISESFKAYIEKDLVEIKYK